MLVQHVVLHEVDSQSGNTCLAIQLTLRCAWHQDSISHDMSVRTPNRGSLPTSRKRVISRVVVLVVCSAAVLLLCWSSSKPGAGTSLQDPATASQQSKVVRSRLEVAYPSCVDCVYAVQSLSISGALQSFKRSLRQWDRHGKDYLGMCLFIKVHRCWLMWRHTCTFCVAGRVYMVPTAAVISTEPARRRAGVGGPPPGNRCGRML